MTTAIFDLDGTLTKRDTYIPFLVLCMKAFGVRRFSVAFLPFYVLLYLCGIITNGRLKELFLSTILSGISVERLEPVTEKFVSRLIDRGLNRTVHEIVKSHLDQKHNVILATASIDLYVLKFAEKIGIKQVVCTRSEVKDGIITGRLLGNNCHGREKAIRIKTLLSGSGRSASIFYTDHHSDLPLLKKVKKGVLVNPGTKTRMLAKKITCTILHVK